MQCNNIQEKLSDYIDGMLSPEEKTSIEEHLKTCRSCSASLADLKKTIGYVKDIGEVEPPSWLAQKVMTRIRAEAEQGKGIFRRLFSPLYIRIPAGAVATIAIAITAAYIFKTIQPQMKPAETPYVEVTKSKAPATQTGKLETSGQPEELKATPAQKNNEALPPLREYKKGVLSEEQYGVAALRENEAAPEKPAEMPATVQEPVISGKHAGTASAPAEGISVMGEIKGKPAPKKEKKLLIAQDAENKIDKQMTCFTDKRIYIQGDNVYITVANTSAHDIEIVDRKFIDGGFAKIEVKTPEGGWKGIELFSAANVLVSKILKPDESHVYTWKTAGYNSSDTVAVPGIYRICIGSLECTDTFEIKAE